MPHSQSDLTRPRIYTFSGDSTQYLKLTWSDVMTSSIALARSIRAAGQSYDRLITLGKGGWPLARILADLLQLPDAASLGISFYDGLVRKAEPSLSQELPTSVAGQRLLLVDDVVDTGDSIEFARSYLQKMQAGRVDTAALYYKPKSSYKPDFFAAETTAWIIFPHEDVEGIAGLSAKWSASGVGESEIEKRLKELGFDQAVLQYAREIGATH